MTDRSVTVFLKGNAADFNRMLLGAAAGTKAFTKELDTSTDRMGNLVQTSLALGPAVVPITAAAVPALSGLTNQLGFATLGAGTAVLAFSGLGKALDAVNKYSIEPTTANFENMQQTMAKLGPDGREFVLFLQGLRPELQKLQDMAQAGLLPGAEEGITELMQLLPQAERIVGTVASTLGDLIAEAGDNLNDPRWQEFFTFLETEAQPTLMDMGRTLGNFAEGFANLWMAFDPLSDDFSASFLQLSRDFATWTDGLDQTQGFEDFLAYVERVGPEAWDTLGALGNALVQLVEAAAPVGEVSLPIIRGIADAFSAIADSPVGPVLLGAAAAISTLSRSMVLFERANTGSVGTFLNKVGGQGAGFRAAAAGAGIYALSLTNLDDKMGLTNTATFALAGAVAGPWGAAIGGATGLVLDLAAAGGTLKETFKSAAEAVGANQASLEQQAAAIDAARKAAAEARSEFGVGHKSDDENDRNLQALEAQYARNVAAARDMRIEEAGLSGDLAGTSEATRDQVDAMLQLIDTRNAAANQALTSREAERALQEAIDGATESAKKNGATHNTDIEQGRANEEALDRIASAWNNLDVEQQNVAGKQDQVRAQFVKAAESMGYTEKQAKSLAGELLEIPGDYVANVVLNGAAPASVAAKAVRAALLNIPNLTIATIRTIEETFVVPKKSDPKPSLKDMLNRADGGLLRGPGGPRDDLIPVAASNGEFIVNAYATSRNLGLLHAINAQKFADGGVVRPYAGAGYGEAAAPAFGPALDSRVLANALATATERAMTKSLEGAVFVTMSDGTTRLKNLGA